MDELLDQVPSWLLRSLPANATADEKLHAKIDKLSKNLPETISEIQAALDAVKTFNEYDAAANRAGAHVWKALESFYAAESPRVRTALLSFAAEHMVEQAQARICRRLSKDSAVGVRRKARTMVQNAGFHEVALPREADGDWDATGWLRGSDVGPLSRHKQGTKVQSEHGLPKLATIADLRKLLGIKSERQLGWFLLATDAENGPYI